VLPGRQRGEDQHGEHDLGDAKAAHHVFRRAFHGMPPQQQDMLSQLLRNVAENLR
jgi:hypothetical protein